MIDVARDREGVRMALEEIFEEDFLHSRLARELENANEQTRQRIEERMPVRTLSPGYYSLALHLVATEQLFKAGISFGVGAIADFEAAGLVALARAREAFGTRHPACSACGAHQQNRFGAECHACGIKFRRKGI